MNGDSLSKPLVSQFLQDVLKQLYGSHKVTEGWLRLVYKWSTNMRWNTDGIFAYRLGSTNILISLVDGLWCFVKATSSALSSKTQSLTCYVNSTRASFFLVGAMLSSLGNNLFFTFHQMKLSLEKLQQGIMVAEPPLEPEWSHSISLSLFWGGCWVTRKKTPEIHLRNCWTSGVGILWEETALCFSPDPSPGHDPQECHW